MAGKYFAEVAMMSLLCSIVVVVLRYDFINLWCSLHYISELQFFKS